jgi:hypothetical protein
LKTELINFGLACWHLLTEVPGWPDAPRRMRWRRVLPIIIPCAALLLLAGWNAAVRDPHIRKERANHQPLLSLEEDIAAAARLLLGTPAELGPLLHTLKTEATGRHWEANFQAGDASAETPEPDAQVIFLPVRARLSSAPGGPGPFPALIALLEQFSSAEKRIDLTRLAIRADEQGRYAVEMNLRLACPRIHEKTAQ